MLFLSVPCHIIRQTKDKSTKIMIDFKLKFYENFIKFL